MFHLQHLVLILLYDGNAGRADNAGHTDKLGRQNVDVVRNLKMQIQQCIPVKYTYMYNMHLAGSSFSPVL